MTFRGMRRLALAVACMALLSVSAEAEEVHLTYSHFEQNKSLSYAVDAADGDTIVVDIVDTCPSQFTFNVEGIERAPEELGTREPECPAATKQVRWKHEGKYGGYLLTISASGPVTVKKEGASPPTRKLLSVVVVVQVRASGWGLEVSGGFTIDGLVSPRYALQKQTTNGTEATYVVRDKGTDDAANLGVASFIHVFHRKVPVLALSFGLGLNQTGRGTYYTGLSLRMGSKAAITGGAAWGQIERLPAGVTTTTAVTNPNVLSNLPTRLTGKAFIAFSYGFLGSKDQLSKPFAGEQKPVQ